MTDERQDLRATKDVVVARDDRAMRRFELATAATVILAAVLLTLAR